METRWDKTDRSLPAPVREGELVQGRDMEWVPEAVRGSGRAKAAAVVEVHFHPVVAGYPCRNAWKTAR